MSKILVLTTAVITAGAAVIAEAIKANPEGAAADVLVLEEERIAALAVAEASLKEVEKQPAKAIEPSFTLEDKHYGFNFKAMTHKGDRITIKDVLESEALQQELVEMESGMIRQIP